MIPSMLIGFGIGLLPMWAAILSRNSWRRLSIAWREHCSDLEADLAEADRLRRYTKRDALGRWSR